MVWCVWWKYEYKSSTTSHYFIILQFQRLFVVLFFKSREMELLSDIYIVSSAIYRHWILAILENVQTYLSNQHVYRERQQEMVTRYSLYFHFMKSKSWSTLLSSEELSQWSKVLSQLHKSRCFKPDMVPWCYVLCPWTGHLIYIVPMRLHDW